TLRGSGGELIPFSTSSARRSIFSARFFSDSGSETPSRSRFTDRIYSYQIYPTEDCSLFDNSADALQTIIDWCSHNS
ncbi:hypothetical protein DERP_002544, partial [Dermatophagoides pteronyssinus]